MDGYAELGTGGCALPPVAVELCQDSVQKRQQASASLFEVCRMQVQMSSARLGSSF